MSRGRFWTRRTPFWGWDVFSGVLTSSRRYLWRRHLDSKMAAPEMTSTGTWGEFFDPHCGGGGKWQPFRFRSPSWMTSFADMRSSKMATGSGRAGIFLHLHNGDRKTLPILLLTLSFSGLGKDNCKTRRETLKCRDLVRLILETLQYIWCYIYYLCMYIFQLYLVLIIVPSRRP